MQRKLITTVFLTLFLAWATHVDFALAQNPSGEISNTLSRLKENPRYDGRVLGTHLRRHAHGYLYEVRILRRHDDRVILVYIDPETGHVVGDSETRPRRLSPRGGP